MVKVRPVVVISPRLPYRASIATVVPISLTAPFKLLPFTVRLSRNYNPSEDVDRPCWAKCDMVANVGLHRLQGFKTGRRQRAYPQMLGDDLKAVREGVVHGLGLGTLLKMPN